MTHIVRSCTVLLAVMRASVTSLACIYSYDEVFSIIQMCYIFILVCLHVVLMSCYE